MILCRFKGALMVVRQVDHGRQAGEFARAWGAEGVPVPSRPEAAVLAARHHDDGWVGWDDHPTLDPGTGQPVQFKELTPFEHVPIYRRGIARAAERDPYVGLLVSMHGVGIYNGRYATVEAHRDLTELERALVEEFLADQRRLQSELGRLAGADRPGEAELPGVDRPAGHVTARAGVWGDYLLLQLWDRLSLQFLYGQAGDALLAPLGAAAPAGGLRCLADGELALRVSPYPFHPGQTEFPVLARLLPDRRYRSPEDFLAAAAGAPQEWLVCRARPG